MLSLEADAATISVISYEGGRKLNFGNVDTDSLVSRELKITVTSSDNIPYQVKRIIIQPITSEKGSPLKEDVLSFYTVRGSNARGSLYRTIKEPMSFRDEVLYISDGQGTSDSFKLVYVFDGKKLTTPGSFYGRVGYVLEPKSGSAQTSVFDIRFNAQLEFEVQMEMLGRTLKLSTKSEQDYSGYVDFHLKSSAGRRLDIYQRPEVFPANDQGVVLAEGAIKFYISAKEQFQSPTVLEKAEALIYSSQEATDSFRINFMIDPEKLKNTESGIYRGKLIYRLQEKDRQKIIPLDIVVGLERVFDIKVTSEGLAYNLKPDSLPQEKIVLIDVESNLQTAYQISQTFSRPLTDLKGNTIAAKYFSMRQELLKGAGEAMFPQFAPVESGESTIFISDNKGENASLQVIYRLTPSIDISAGNYSTSVTYSLSER